MPAATSQSYHLVRKGRCTVEITSDASFADASVDPEADIVTAESVRSVVAIVAGVRENGNETFNRGRSHRRDGGVRWERKRRRLLVRRELHGAASQERKRRLLQSTVHPALSPAGSIRLQSHQRYPRCHIYKNVSPIDGCVFYGVLRCDVTAIISR